LEKIPSGDRTWRKLVPFEVGSMIEERGMFHCASWPRKSHTDDSAI